jgi:hypothetical protein
MREDKHHIKMENISEFIVERSADYSFWQEISHQELNESFLNDLPEEKLKVFLGVMRTGSAIKLGDYFYRLQPEQH